MQSQNGNGGPGGPWGGGRKPGSDIEDLVRQGQDRLKQILPSGGLRLAIFLAALAAVGLGRMDDLLHCAERLCCCRATFR